MLSQNPTSDAYSNFFTRLFAAGGAAADKALSALNPLPLTASQGPELPPHLSAAIDGFADILPISTVLAVGAMPARGTLPGVPARVHVISVFGSRVLPQPLWEELVSGGWVTTSGELTAQYEADYAAKYEG